MPYIKPEYRKEIDEAIKSIALTGKVRSEGDLNYTISKLLHEWLELYGVNYANINTLIGVLECAKLELYRQIAAPYEDTKKQENGPVSDFDK